MQSLPRRPDPSDQALFVEFHDVAVKDPIATKLAGLDQYKDVTYCKIVLDPFTTNDGPVKDSEEYSDIQRFPDAYEIYKAKRTGERIGTPLKLLTGMTPAKIKNYENADIYSVEQLSLQPDQTISKFMGGLADRKEALKYLENAKAAYSTAESDKKFEAIQVQLDAQADALAEKDRLIAELLKEKKKTTKGAKDED